MATNSVTSRKVKVAAIQAAPVSFDLTATLQKLSKLTSAAASEGAELVVFPEAFVSAYPRGYDFGAVVGNRSQEGRNWFKRYHESSIAIPSPEFDKLAAAARTNKVFLQVGIIEKDGGTLYCSAVCFGKDGSLLYKHRKLMPTGSERLVWGFGDGSGLNVVDTEIGKLTSLICWENYMPLARMTLYQQGVQIYMAPTADGRETWPPLIQTIAQEGRCFVISVNQYSTYGDYPSDYPPARDVKSPSETVLSTGGSCIVSPLGQFLAGPVWNKEEILYADLDLGDILMAKMDFDVTGHYSRPDVFRLTVDESPKAPVVFGGK